MFGAKYKGSLVQNTEDFWCKIQGIFSAKYRGFHGKATLITLSYIAIKTTKQKEHIFITMYHSEKERTQGYLTPIVNGTYNSTIILVI